MVFEWSPDQVLTVHEEVIVLAGTCLLQADGRKLCGQGARVNVWLIHGTAKDIAHADTVGCVRVERGGPLAPLLAECGFYGI